MLQTLESLLAPAVMERLALVVNHVLASEAVATERLKPHAGRTIELVASGWPSLLPPAPPCVYRVTPAGMVEWVGPAREVGADLTLRIDASNPALLVTKMLAGEQPPVAVEGDAQLAGDVNWLMQNLRWDVEADLERLFGPTVAVQLHRLGRAVAHALRAAVQGLGQLSGRLRPGA
jgi:ubiquinone biosynthesis accessory factor UbiJ